MHLNNSDCLTGRQILRDGMMALHLVPGEISITLGQS